jgi:ammonium transporter, Amt family
MTRSWLVRGSLLGLVLALAIPAVAFADAQTLEAFNDKKLSQTVAINSIWVILAGVLVMFMHTGFAFL